MSKICTLINNSIPPECTFLVETGIKIQYSDIWDITWDIKSGTYNGESYNMPYNVINIGFNARDLGFEVKSGEVLYESCTNCHIVDYINGISIPLSGNYIYLCGSSRPVPPEPTVTYANFCEPQSKPILNNINNAQYIGFFPYDNLSEWTASIKYRLYFNKPISQLMFRNSIDAFFNEKNNVGNNINLTPNVNIDFKNGEWKNIGQYWNQNQYFPSAQILVTYEAVTE